MRMKAKGKRIIAIPSEEIFYRAWLDAPYWEIESVTLKNNTVYISVIEKNYSEVPPRD